MAVGEDEAVGRDDDAGAGAATVAAIAAAGMHLQADHRRADPVDHVDDGPRIGVEQRLIGGGDFRG